MYEPKDGIVPARSGSCLVLRIHRPNRRNALSAKAAEFLAARVAEAGDDSSVRAVILTGSGGKVFVSGGDLHEFARYPAGRQGADKVLEMGHVAQAIERSPVPVIAAVDGAAFGGGCELVVACDMVVADETASFTFRQAAMGLSTGWGGGTRLVERVGPMQAARLLLTGETVMAGEALAIGLVNEVTPRGACLARALDLGNRVAALPRASVAGIKRMLLSVKTARRGNAVEQEADVFRTLWGGPDHQAAMGAFLAGRRKGRGGGGEA